MDTAVFTNLLQFAKNGNHFVDFYSKTFASSFFDGNAKKYFTKVIYKTSYNRVFAFFYLSTAL